MLGKLYVALFRLYYFQPFYNWFPGIFPQFLHIKLLISHDSNSVCQTMNIRYIIVIRNFFFDTKTWLSLLRAGPSYSY